MKRRNFLRKGLEGIVVASAIPKFVKADDLNDRLLWKLDIGFGNSISSPAIGSDGTVYIGSGDGNVYAINPKGTIKWKYKSSRPWVNSSPAIAEDGTIYIGDYSLLAFDPDGNLKWERLTGRIEGCPAIGSDDTVYVGAADNNLHAFSHDGNLKWKFPTGYFIYSSPAIDQEGNIYFTSYDGNIYSLNPNGNLRWKENILTIPKVNPEMDSSPAIDFEGNIYVGSGDGNVYAFDPDGEIKWTGGAPTFSSPAIGSDGTVYVGTDGLNAINSNGKHKWKYERWIGSSPTIAKDGTIYVGSENLLAINIDGTLKWEYETDSPVVSSPAINNNGIIYFGSFEGTLYAIDSSTGIGIDKDAPWPMFGHDLKHTSRATDKEDISTKVNEKPSEFYLNAYPNPFNEATTIRYNIPTTTKVSLVVYNSSGQLVERLLDKVEQQGPHEIMFNPRSHNLSSGVYFYQLWTPMFTEKNKMMLVK